MSSENPITPTFTHPILFDFTKLDELAEGEQEFKDQILELVIEQSNETLDGLNTYGQAQNYAQLKEVAHKYKSSVHVLGNQEILNLFKVLEDQCANALNPQEIVRLTKEGKKVCQMIIQQLSEEIS